ncbi:hypothetical protein Tco_0839731 [Tanacetum coccineum]|uniref:Uncharacterized protein n=1 Tax=Tanacetum coccineum TaxID=301880 RepID=A0ABQ5ATB8_9ASTR
MHILRGSEWYMMAIVKIPKTDPVINLSGVIRLVRLGKYGDSDGYTFDDPILILEILSRRFLLRGIYLITGSSKDGDGDTSFQWSQFTTQCSHLMFPSKDIMTTE